MENKINATVVILTLNEIEGLRQIFSKIPVSKCGEIFAVDGGSTDGSLDFYKKHNITVHSQKKKGRGEAFRLAIEKAKFENIIFFSPDGNENPEDIERIAEYLNSDYDMVIASRFMKESRNEEDGQFLPLRLWANRIFTWLANIIWNKNEYVTDTINGYRGIKKKIFQQLNPDAQGFVIEYQLSIRAMKLNKKIKEIPTIEGNRIGGESKAKSIPTGLIFLKKI